MKTLIGLLLALFLVSCSSTRIFPQEDGSYLMVATSSSDSRAHDAALEKSTEHCQTMGKSFVLVKNNSTYQGVDKNAKMVVGAINAFARPKNGHINDGSNSDDYKVEIVFRCK